MVQKQSEKTSYTLKYTKATLFSWKLEKNSNFLILSYVLVQRILNRSIQVS